MSERKVYLNECGFAVLEMDELADNNMVLLSINNNAKYFDAKIIEIVAVRRLIKIADQEYLHEGQIYM